MKLTLKKYIKLTTSLAAGILLSLSFPDEADASGTILYEVQPGDTLFSSAQSFGKSTDEVASLNELADANVIQPGELLVIEGSQEELTDIRATLSSEGFIETVGSQANEIASEHGLYASVMVAQAALESSYGNSRLAAPPAHNLFGIKSGSGEDQIVLSTSEYLNDQWIQPKESFKKYPDYQASMLDNAQLLRNGNSWDSNHYAGAWVENTSDYSEATESLEGRYATDPKYDTKLDNIIEAYDLTQYDSKEAKETESQTTAPQENIETYRVRAGDTVYNISNRYGMTVSELKNLNNLSSNRIQQGQTLQVHQAREAAEHTTTHIVSAKDTLYSLSNRYNMTVSELQRLNGLNSNRIKRGQTLEVKQTAQTTQQNNTTHTVAPSDTLYNIANRYEMTVSELKQLNQLSSNNITLGQTLNVNGSAQTNQTHTVQPGDTLYNISNRYGLTVEELKTKNNNPSNHIQLGQELQV